MYSLSHKFDKKRTDFLKVVLLAMVITALIPYAAWATGSTGATGSATGQNLPWEGSLNALANSLTGPVALALSLIMVVVGVGALMFGGDLAGWGRWVAFACIAAGTLGGSVNMVKALGVTGAVI